MESSGADKEFGRITCVASPFDFGASPIRDEQLGLGSERCRNPIYSALGAPDIFGYCDYMGWGIFGAPCNSL